jgi:hypothetical protein
MAREFTLPKTKARRLRSRLLGLPVVVATVDLGWGAGTCADFGAGAALGAHTQKEFAAGAPRRRSTFSPGTRRRTVPIRRSAQPFCHGDPGEIGRSRIPVALSRDVKTCP